MTITDKLEGLLPENGPVTKDERVIAEAVAELRETAERLGYARGAYMELMGAYFDLLGDSPPDKPRSYRIVATIAVLAFSTGCIASAIYVVLV